jgi:hypothetical protein
MKKLRGRWSPTPEHINTLIDCSVARMSVERTAQLLGVGPRTIRIFANRLGRPFAAPAGRSRDASLGNINASLGNINASEVNKSGFKGVFFLERKGRCPWRAAIRIRGKMRHLGRFDTREEAALRYATVAYAVHGEFANPHWRDMLGSMRGVRCP